MHYANIQKRFSFKTSFKLASCAGLVALGDFLFFDVPVGWTLGLFGLVLLLAVRCHSNPMGRRRATDIATLATLGLSLALIEMPTVETLVLYSFSIMTLALLPKLSRLDDARMLARSLLRYLFRGWIRLLMDGLMISHVLKRLQKRNGRKRSFVRHWLLPCVMSGIFVLLFAKANPIITQWLDKIEWYGLMQYLSFSRICFATAIALSSWALIRPKFKHPLKKAPSELKTKQPFTLTALLFNERSITTSLLLFNGLFLVQNLMDVAFLWSGTALPEGMTYASYAHQGAYPLIATALLAAAFVLIALKPGSATEQVSVIRNLVFAWVGQNIFLVLSSIIRTVGYIEEYSLTYLRVAALIWMVLVALGLVLIIARIRLRKTNLWLINANSMAMVATLYLCCFINVGGFIAWHNVTHASEVTQHGTPLDVGYLTRSIGVEAIPALLWFEHHYPHSGKLHAVQDARQSLAAELDDSMNDWRRWNFREFRIARAIASPTYRY
ncbi:MAG: DUF4173 domain-containing protein [Pseudomonadota bacterium]